MEDLFTKVKILEQCRSARSGLERVLIVENRAALGRRQQRVIWSGDLMEFAAFTANERLIVNRCIGGVALGHR